MAKKRKFVRREFGAPRRCYQAQAFVPGIGWTGLSNPMPTWALAKHACKKSKSWKAARRCVVVEKKCRYGERLVTKY